MGVLIVFLAANHRLVMGKAFPLWDADRQFSTWQMLIADFARNRQLLLWNPWSCGGVPEFAEPQTGALSPLSIFSGFLTGGELKGFIVWWLGNWLMGGLGMLGLARHLGAPAWGSFAVALGYLFSGFYTGHAQHLSWIHAYSFLPFLVWWFDRSCLDRSWRKAFETGALWGLSGLAGYPGHLVLTWSVLPLWAVGRYVAGRSSADAAPRQGQGLPSYPSLRRCGAHLAIILVSGAIVLSPAYFGYFTEAVRYSTRTQSGGWTRELAIASNALDPSALATFASPWMTQIELHSRNRMWLSDVSSCSVYAGPILPLFALLALLGRPRDRWRWWLAAMMTLMVMIAVGDRLPVRGWLYDFLPPFRYFRHSAMFRGYALFFLAVMAILGTRDLASRSRGSPRRGDWAFPIVASVLAAAAFWAFASLIERSGAWAIAGYGLAKLHLYAVWLVPPILGLLWIRNRTRALIPGLLVALAAADAVMAVHLGDCTIYTGIPEEGRVWRALDASHTSSLDLIANDRPRILQLGQGKHNKNLEIKWPTLVNYTALINAHHDSIAASPALAGLALGRQRFWFSSRPVQLPVTDGVIDALVARAEKGEGVPLVVHPPESMPGSTAREDSLAVIRSVGEAPPVEPLFTRFHEYTPRRLYFSVSAPEEGWLLVTDRWSPGWKATVNRRPASVFGGNGVYRAVKIAKGENLVHFDYRPPGVAALVIMSWLILGLAMVSGGARLLEGRRASSEIIELTPAGGEREVSFVIPCYNGEGHIEDTVRRLLDRIRANHWDAEIIVVDDGSSDGTETAAMNAAAGNAAVRVIRHRENQGKGRAVRTGMLSAGGRRRLFTDSDLPYRIEDLSAALSALAEADVVVGNRMLAGSKRISQASLRRRMTSRVFHRLASVFRLQITDTQCGLKAFREDACRRIFERSRVDGFGFDVEILIIARAQGLRVRSIPVTLERSDWSSVRIVRHSLEMLGELGEIGINILRGRYR